MTKPTFAVDIGGTKTAIALVADGEVLERRQANTPAQDGPDAIVSMVLESGKDWLKKVGCIGVACAGTVQEDRVWAVSTSILPGWQGYPLVKVLKKATGLPSSVLNDAQAAAWGEYRHGAAKGYASMYFMTVSTGIGGGAVVNHQLLIGARGFAGHVGHTTASQEGPVCSCGRRGCLEMVASGSALARQAAALGFELSAREVFQQAESGEHWASQLILQSASAVVQAMADIKALFDPDTLVIGGSVGLNPHYFNTLLASQEQLPHLYQLAIRPAQLGPDAGLIGAADWVER